MGSSRITSHSVGDLNVKVEVAKTTLNLVRAG